MTCWVLTRVVVFTLWTLDLWGVVGCFLEGVLVNKENPAGGMGFGVAGERAAGQSG